MILYERLVSEVSEGRGTDVRPKTCKGACANIDSGQVLHFARITIAAAAAAANIAGQTVVAGAEGRG